MKSMHVHIRPYRPSTNSRVDVYIAAGRDPSTFGVADLNWNAAFSRQPEKTVELFDLTLSGRFQVPQLRFELHLRELVHIAGVEELQWKGSPVFFYSVEDLNWSQRTLEFAGRVNSAPYSNDRRKVGIEAAGSLDRVTKPLLTESFDGSGGLGGEPEKRDLLKPAGWGYVENLTPVFFDETRNMAMLDGYGNLLEITQVFEGLNPFTSFAGDYPNIAALTTAYDAGAILAGQWASSIADGIIVFGAPPVGEITCHARFGLNRAGAIMKSWLLDHADLSPQLVAESDFDDLDSVMPYEVRFWTDQQQDIKTLMEQMCATVLATPIIRPDNQFGITSIIGGVPVGILDKSGAQLPRVLASRPAEQFTPTYKTAARAARPAVVLRRDQVNFADDFVPRGVFKLTEQYRLGNTVFGPDKAEWLYINQAPAFGEDAPLPVWPSESNAYWQNVQPPVQLEFVVGNLDDIPDGEDRVAVPLTQRDKLFTVEDYATNGAIIPIPGSGQPGNVKDGAGNLRPPGELLNSMIEQTASGRLQYRPLPDAPPVSLGQITLPALGAVSEAAMRRAEDDIDQLGRALATALDEVSGTRATFRDAGFYADPATGQVRIHAIEQTKERVNTAEIRLGAAEASIRLRATTSYVNEAIALAAFDPSQIADLTEVFLRLGEAEVNIDGLNATVSTLATVTELSLLEGRVSTAQEEIDALEGLVSTKVSTTTFNALETRVTNAESTILAIGDSAQISNAVSATRLIDKQQTAGAENDLRALLAGDQAKREQIAAIASAREELTARIIEGDAAEASLRQLLQVRVGAAESSIANEIVTRANQTSALASQIFSLNARLNTDVGSLQAEINEAKQAIVDEEGARSLAISQVSASLSGLTQDLSDALTDEQQARIDAINAATSDLIGQIEAEALARGEALTAEEQARIQALEAERQQTIADIQAERQAREQAIIDVEAQVEQIEQASVERDGTLQASISREASLVRGSRKDLDNLVDQLLSGLIFTEKSAREAGQQLAVVREEITALIESEVSGIVSRVVGLALRLGDTEGAIRELDRVVIENNSALVQSIDNLNLNVTRTRSDLEGTISSTRSDFLGSLNTTRSELEQADQNTLGRVDGLEGDLADEAQARQQGDANEAQAREIAISAAITSERLLWQEGDGVLAGIIDEVSTTVDENTATLTQFGESIDGLRAAAGIRIDINGRVTGIGVNADADTTKFVGLVDQFELVDPENGEVYLGADADGLRLQNGKVIMDNGTFMKVTGTGFGTASQFIEWFGPSRALNMCDEASAFSYLKTNGDAYFGGTLSAGIIRNAAKSTSIAPDASITIGPFGSNGGLIQVITSYSIQSELIVDYPATPQGVSDWEEAVALFGATPAGTSPDRYVSATRPFSCSVAVQVEREVPGSTTSPWATLTITGGIDGLEGFAPIPGDTPGRLTYTRGVSGSITSTDAAGSTANRTLTATLTERSGAVFGQIKSQIISLTATEE